MFTIDSKYVVIIERKPPYQVLEVYKQIVHTFLFHNTSSMQPASAESVSKPIGLFTIDSFLEKTNLPLYCFHLCWMREVDNYLSETEYQEK